MPAAPSVPPTSSTPPWSRWSAGCCWHCPRDRYGDHLGRHDHVRLGDGPDSLPTLVRALLARMETAE
ncbi:hypothetical protein GT002_31575 [Streptomyces sp. SID4917]|nr:hypothetical protein [Streptomyces sp. SID4917]